MMRILQLLLLAPLLASAVKPFKASKENKETIGAMNSKAMDRAGNPSFKHPKCPQKLSKAAMIQKSFKMRSLAAAKLPDPTCKTGVVSLAGDGPDPQVCCPAYCGECTDYPDCSSVRGQDSTFRCCASKVMERSCEHTRTPANICLKSCSETVPPCIMAVGETWEAPDVTSAAEDCNNAINDWMTQAKSAVTGVPGAENGGPSGQEQWDETVVYKLEGVTHH